MQPNKAYAPALGLRILLLNAACDRVHFGLRLSQCDSRLQASDGVVVMKLAAFGLKVQSCDPDSRMRCKRRRIIIGKAGGEDADHGVSLSIERNWFPDECRIASVVLLPQPVAQKSH